MKFRKKQSHLFLCRMTAVQSPERLAAELCRTDVLS